MTCGHLQPAACVHPASPGNSNPVECGSHTQEQTFLLTDRPTLQNIALIFSHLASLRYVYFYLLERQRDGDLGHKGIPPATGSLSQTARLGFTHTRFNCVNLFSLLPSKKPQNIVRVTLASLVPSPMKEVLTALLEADHPTQ